VQDASTQCKSNKNDRSSGPIFPGLSVRWYQIGVGIVCMQKPLASWEE
jgi:hypothetical protein